MTLEEQGCTLFDLRVMLDALEDFAHESLAFCNVRHNGELVAPVSTRQAERAHVLIRHAAQLARKLQTEPVEDAE